MESTEVPLLVRKDTGVDEVFLVEENGHESRPLAKCGCDGILWVVFAAITTCALLVPPLAVGIISAIKGECNFQAYWILASVVAFVCIVGLFAREFWIVAQKKKSGVSRWGCRESASPIFARVICALYTSMAIIINIVQFAVVSKEEQNKCHTEIVILVIWTPVFLLAIACMGMCIVNILGEHGIELWCQREQDNQ